MGSVISEIQSSDMGRGLLAIIQSMQREHDDKIAAQNRQIERLINLMPEPSCTPVIKLSECLK